MNQIDLKGRVAVITGGAQGIGYAISQRMLNSGARVVMWDIDGAKIKEACASLGALGLHAEASFEDIIRLYIEDCRRDNPQALKGMDA